MNRDVRNLVLIKSAIDNSKFISLKSLGSSNLNSGLTPYLSFGDYDALYTYKVEEYQKDLLNNILNESNALSNIYDGTIFIHPMYAVLNYEDSEKEEILDFWNKNDSNFIFISSVYLKGIDVSFPNINCFKLEVKKILGEINTCSYLVYQTLDLSDYVIIWKSNDIRPIIEAIQKLYKNKENLIGYINTVCAINYLHISSSEKHFEKYFSVINPDDDIDIANIYNVSSPHNKNIFKDSIEKLNPQSKSNKSFFVLGNDDFIKSFNKIKTRELFRLLHETFKDSTTTNNNHYGTINRTFTQIGLDCTSNNITEPYHQESSNEANNCKNLYSICKKIHDRFLNKKNHNVFKNLEWVNVSVELTNLMTVMSQSDIFKSVCLLLIESVNFFSSWLDYLIQISDSESDLKNKLYNNDEAIQTFVRSWKQLIDNVVHSDGVSVQVPGYSMFSNNIFNTIVEYCACYFKALSELFFKIDNLTDESIQMACVISPKLCRRIKTVEMFYGNKNKDSLLSLEVPISDMLNPFMTLASLTHEAAHYCGEKTREKKIRKIIFISCVAQIVIDNLGICDKAVHDKLYNMIEQWVDNLSNKKEEQFYLDELAERIEHATKNILCSYDYLNSLISIYANNDETKITHNLVSNVIASTYDMLNGRKSINEHVRRIEYFLKECYADVIMIKILDLSFSDYVKILLSEFKRINIEDNSHKNIFYGFIHRLLMVRESCKNKIVNFDYNLSISNDDELTKSVDIRIINILEDMIELFDEKYKLYNDCEIEDYRFFNENFYSLDIFKSVIFYLDSCLNVFEQETAGINNIDVLREIYRTVVINDDYFTEKFYNYLNGYREQVLSNFDEKGNFKSKCIFE